MSFVVVIPARYAATRLPGKPLREIAGRPMIEYVYRRATESGAREVIIATDDERIACVAREFGARVCMTDAAHPSGTDRIAEVARVMAYADDQVIVNLQCDEPGMPAALIDQVAGNIRARSQASIATLCEEIESAEALFNPNVVKVALDQESYALYFSRAPIPWVRDSFSMSRDALPPGGEHYRHIGLYAYCAGFVREYVSWTPCPLERMEALEQLRALWHGRRVHVDLARERPGHGVDTESDLQNAERSLR